MVNTQTSAYLPLSKIFELLSLPESIDRQGHAIFEIGRRLKHVKENDLTHGQFGKWCKEQCNMNPSVASRFITAYEQFKDVKLTISSILESSKIFEIISLPESIDRQEFINQKHIIPSTGEQSAKLECFYLALFFYSSI